jgi:hypothetical protein
MIEWRNSRSELRLNPLRDCSCWKLQCMTWYCLSLFLGWKKIVRRYTVQSRSIGLRNQSYTGSFGLSRKAADGPLVHM